jgi:hypothetical protein
VYTLNPAARCKSALVELRHLKAEAREANKLLEDKKALEAKVLLFLMCSCGGDVGRESPSNRDTFSSTL